MSIKVMYKKTAVILLTIAVLFLAVPMTVFAAPGIDIIYTASTYENIGNTINVTISTTGGASISTLGLRLYYDKEKLEYQRSQWAENLQNSNSSMTLVSDVEYNGSQVLNISMISDGGYQSGNVLVTLVFMVKEGYTENPFKLELREITDENLQNIETTTNIVYQNTGNGSGGETDSSGTGTGSSSGNTGSSGSGTNNQTDSMNGTNTNINTENGGGNVTDQNAGGSGIGINTSGNTNINNENGNGGSGTDHNPSGSGIGNSASGSTAGNDKEPKTGVDDYIEVYATMVMIAGLYCIMRLFLEKNGMTEDEKQSYISRLIRWSNRGGKFRRLLAMAAIFLLLVYYHSIGKQNMVVENAYTR